MLTLPKIYLKFNAPPGKTLNTDVYTNCGVVDSVMMGVVPNTLIAAPPVPITPAVNKFELMPVPPPALAKVEPCVRKLIPGAIPNPGAV